MVADPFTGALSRNETPHSAFQFVLAHQSAQLLMIKTKHFIFYLRISYSSLANQMELQQLGQKVSVEKVQFSH